MSAIRLTATAGPEGVPHLNVPVGAAGEFEVQAVVTRKPAAPGARPKTSEERGWPPGFLESTFGSITDEKFVAPPHPPAEPLSRWDEE